MNIKPIFGLIILSILGGQPPAAKNITIGAGAAKCQISDCIYIIHF